MTSVSVKLRKGTTSEHSTFTGANAEVTVDTTKHTAVVHDGEKAGGYPLQKAPVVLTWSQLQALPTADITPYVDRFFVTDVGVGGSEWYWDGSRYRAVGGQVVLKSINGGSLISHSVTATAGNTATSSLLSIPAGVMRGGDEVLFECSFTNTSGNTAGYLGFIYLTDSAAVGRVIGQASTTLGAGNSFTFSMGVKTEGTDLIARPIRNGGSSGFGISPSSTVPTPSVSLSAGAQRDFALQTYQNGAAAFTVEYRTITATLKTCG